jgi:hypothetical protein
MLRAQVSAAPGVKQKYSSSKAGVKRLFETLMRTLRDAARTGLNAK